MNNLLERFIKRNNKKRGINITVATMVMFLLSCTGVYAKNIEENDSAQLKDVVNNSILNKIKLNSTTHIANLMNIKNNGKIVDLNGRAIDIYGKVEGNINHLENNGEIQGIVIGSDGIVQLKEIYNRGVISGNGIKIDSLNYGIEDMNNIGIIRGNETAISANENGSLLGGINNSGLLIGKTPISNQTSDEINNGMKISLDDNGKVVKIESENKKDVTVNYNGTTYTIINGDISGNTTNTIYTDKLVDKNSNLILNGVDNTLTINKDFTLNDSVVNAYKTAIKVEGNNIFTGNNVTINGGGLDGETAVILGDKQDNTVNLNGNSIINGNIDLGEGKDKFVLGTSDSAATYSTNNSINITSNISGVENIEVNQDVNISSASKIDGVEKVTIGSSGNLTLGLKANGEKSEHALTGNNATIVGTGVEGSGNLVFDTTEIGKESIVDMSGMKLENVSIKTDSDLYKITNTDGEDLKISVEGSLSGVIENGNSGGAVELPAGYERLNGVYEGFILSSAFEEIKGNLTEADKVVTYTKEIAFQSPYSLSSELSRKSVKGFSNVVVDKDLKPELGKWAVTGGLTHTDGGYSSEGLLGSNTKLEKYRADVDSKMTGLYTFGEYGLDKNSTLGLVFGANNLESKVNNGSDVEGTSVYLGGFAKKYLGNLRLTAGLGYQYGDYEAKRVSIVGTTNEADYSDNAFIVYTDAKYSHEIGKNLYLEPSIGLDYIHISQDSASESGKGALELDSKKFDYTGLRVALDLRKDIVGLGAKHSLVAGAFYDAILDGAEDKDITTRFKGGQEFDTVVSGQNEHNLGLRAKYEVTLENGVSFDVRGSYTFARDTYNGNDKNKSKAEWSLGAGLGYRF